MGLSVRTFSIAFDKVEPTLEQGNFIKSFGSGKIVRYIHHRELVNSIFEFDHKKGKITKILLSFYYGEYFCPTYFSHVKK